MVTIELWKYIVVVLMGICWGMNSFILLDKKLSNKKTTIGDHMWQVIGIIWFVTIAVLNLK